MLDNKHNFDIVPVICKYSAKREIKYSKNIECVKNYIPVPYHYRDNAIINEKRVLDNIERFPYIGKRSHVGLFFTTEEEAKEWQIKLREGKVFNLLKPGSTVYCVSAKTAEKPRALTITAIKNHDNRDNEYEIHFGENGAVIIGETIWEDKASEQLDACFYDYCLDIEEKSYGDKVRLFVNEKDALKAIAETANRKAKSATVKYIKSIENHDGKPILLKDNCGSDLHYRDTILDITRVGYNGHPELRKGVIIGESKTTITVFDEVENKDGKPTGWRGERIEDSAGKHSVQPQSVMLFKLAEVDKKSGYSFVKMT
jgi:hypothetical protein